MGVPVDLVSWREKRGEGLSETLYLGLRLMIEGRPVVVTKLSHGLRVLLIKDHTKYCFEGSSRQIKISENLAEEAGLMLEVDERFQQQLPEYEAIMASVPDQKTVHALLEGLPLCRFSTDVPANWPKGHVSTDPSDETNINCPACCIVAERKGYFSE